VQIGAKLTKTYERISQFTKRSEMATSITTDRLIFALPQTIIADMSARGRIATSEVMSRFTWNRARRSIDMREVREPLTFETLSQVRRLLQEQEIDPCQQTMVVSPQQYSQIVEAAEGRMPINHRSRNSFMGIDIHVDERLGDDVVDALRYTVSSSADTSGFEWDRVIVDEWTDEEPTAREMTEDDKQEKIRQQNLELSRSFNERRNANTTD